VSNILAAEKLIRGSTPDPINRVSCSTEPHNTAGHYSNNIQWCSTIGLTNNSSDISMK